MDRIRFWLSRRISSSCLVFHLAGLQVQQAGDDLQVVLDAVMDLLQQYFLFIEGLPDLFLGSLPLQQQPHALHEERQLPDIGVAVFLFLVGHSGHRHDAFTIEDRDSHVALDSDMPGREIRASTDFGFRSR